MRFEDSGLDDLMDEKGEINAEAAQAISDAAEASEANDIKIVPSDDLALVSESDPAANPFMNGNIKTLDGDTAGDEFAADAINYQVLLGKIDKLLDKLKLDA